MTRALDRAPVRLVLALVLTAGGLSLYAWLNQHLPPKVSFWLPLDGAVPFVPATIVAYVALHGLLPLAAWLTDAVGFVRMAAALLVSNLTCYLGFALATAHYPRPALAAIPAPWNAWYAVLHANDGPGNTFPSIHVATALVVTATLARSSGRGWWLVGACVALSTLTTKQHFVADVVAGAAVAAWGLYVARRVVRAG